MLRPTKILVPTDFSDSSDKALKQALDIAKQYNAEVYLFHVISGEIRQCMADYCMSDEEFQNIETQMVKTAMDNIKGQMEKFPASKEVKVYTDVARGVPYEAILNEEKSKNIDLIVIASLGRTGLAKYFIGSVARNVLKGAKCPVLLTK